VTRFLETDKGWVNVAHITRITERHADDCSSATLYGPTGEVLGRIGQMTTDIDDLTAPIVPAAAGQFAKIIYVWSHIRRPTEQDVWVDEQPIVAWSLRTFGDREPILPEEISNGTVLICLPGGKLLEPDHARFDDIAEAKQHLLDRAQAEWDRKHPTTPPARDLEASK
jgi:hypothetical protein